MVAPLIASAVLAGGSFLMGKAGSGSGILSDNFNKEYNLSEQNTYTDQRSYVYDSQKTIDLQFNYALGDNSKITTKKEQSLSQSPNVSPEASVIPTTSQGGASGAGSGINIYDIAIIGGLGFGLYTFLTKKKDDK